MLWLEIAGPLICIGLLSHNLGLGAARYLCLITAERLQMGRYGLVRPRMIKRLGGSCDTWFQLEIRLRADILCGLAKPRVIAGLGGCNTWVFLAIRLGAGVLL